MFRRIARSVSIGTIAASALVVAGPVAAVVSGPSTALASPPPSYTLGNTAAPVTTSNKQKWELSIAWVQVVPKTPADLSVVLLRPVSSTQFEEHVWEFNDISSGTLAANPTTGAATLKTTNALASISLTFKATSHAKATCLFGSETVFSGTLAGKLTLKTGLTGGGTVGSSSLKFSLGIPQLKVDFSCQPPFPSECANSSEFASSTKGGSAPFAAGLDGLTAGKLTDFVAVNRGVTLSKSPQILRVDTAAVDKAPMTYDAKTNVFSVKTTTSGIVTGSATLSGGKLTTHTLSCSIGKKAYTLSLTGDTGAKYVSPAGKSLTAHTSLTGILKVASSTDASFAITTIKPA
jgi:hypothetical protein